MTARTKILLILPISFGIILALKYFLPEPQENTAAKDHFWTKKTHGRKKFNILIIGDSRTYRGISANKISNETNGLSAINLGYSSTGLDSVYLDFAESRLTSKGERVIVIGVTPYSLTPEAARNYHYNSLASLDKSDIFRNLYLNSFLKFADPYRPNEIRDILAGRTGKKGYFMVYEPDGWVRSYKIPSNPNEALASYVKNFENNKVSFISADYFLRRVKQWCDQGIIVIGYRVPSTDAMVALEDSISGFDPAYISNSFIKAGGIWLEYDNNEFESYDGSHLHFKSAEKLSGLLGQEINRVIEAEKQPQ